MRGKDVMFASYFDTDFTRENMLTGTKLHAVGKVTYESPKDHCLCGCRASQSTT